MNIEPNQIVDERYRIIAKLDEGGMGAVWKATDSRTNDSVVVLKFPLKYRDPEILQRFAHEASTMRELAGDCDNILDIQDIGSVPVNDIDNVPYYVMRFQTGGALRDWKPATDQDGTPIFTRESLDWVNGVARALDFLHHQEVPVYHRDVKPENILFNATGTPKLADFGIVKNIKKATTTITQTGAAMGTVAYMPPEIWRGGDFSPASDQFSFAASVYEMLSGKRPYDGETPFAMLEALSKGHDKLQQSIGLPAGASAALDQALEHEPENRFKTCAAFAKAFLRGLPSEEDRSKKPSEELTGMHVAEGGGFDGLAEVEIVGGTPVDLPSPSNGESNSDDHLFGGDRINSDPHTQSAPVGRSFGPVIGSVIALALVGLIGGGFYIFGALSGTQDQPQTVRTGSSSPDSPATSSSPVTPVSFELAESLFKGTEGESMDKSRAVEIFEQLARDGSLESQKRLGEIHAEGKVGSVDFKEAFKWILMAAKQGDAESQMAVGASYSTGQRGVSRDLPEAVRWLRKSASKDFVPAQIMLGIHYSRGLGVEEDLEEAKRWFERARSFGVPEADGLLADLRARMVKELSYKEYKESPLSLVEQHAEIGFAGAETELGFRASKSGDYAAALKWYRKAEKNNYMRAFNNLGFMYDKGQGVPQDSDKAFAYYKRANQADPDYALAQFNLGVCYDKGKGVDKDEAEAVKWYRKAAEQGYANAQFNLGVCYANGRGVGKDEKEAVRWYRKAAEQDYASAQYNLGNMYANGRGVGKDDHEAVRWYRKAAEQDYASAQFNLGVMYANGSGVGKDEKEAVRWYRKAAEQDHATAQFKLGVSYDNGSGVGKDEKKAVRWYRKAAEQDYANAQYTLGVCYANGSGVGKDEKEAVRWYRKAAEQDDANAQSNLGVCYANGRGVGKDGKEAAKWYRKAAEQGHLNGQFNMGSIYARGQGVKKNITEAIRWYQKAADQGDKEAEERISRLKN